MEGPAHSAEGGCSKQNRSGQSPRSGRSPRRSTECRRHEVNDSALTSGGPFFSTSRSQTAEINMQARFEPIFKTWG
jgi:hypothetical protein